MLFYVTFKTGAGWIGALSSPLGLVKSTFPQKSREQSLLSLEININKVKAVYSGELFTELMEYYTGYLKGIKTVYKGPIDLSRATFFQKMVWTYAMRIPYGEIRTYSWIARNIGNPLACRAVGNALNKNPVPIIIPCHRVIKEDGNLGGFGGGIEMKKYLLSIEGHLIR